jgi:hypothetical protein
MHDDKKHALANSSNEASNEVRSAGDAYPLLRKLGGNAYQLHATARAADHFLSLENRTDRDTGAWLISSAFGISEELASDLDGLAKTLKDRASEASLTSELRLLRTRAHQLQATTRAADHFLEQDSNEDRSTGSWLIAYALGVAEKLASELDDLASRIKRSGNDAAATFSDVSAHRGALRDIAA